MMSVQWDRVGWRELALFSAGFGVFTALWLCSEPGFIFLLDHANLLFHEAGHPLVGLFSARLEPYGGTFSQLVFPVALILAFRRKGKAPGCAAAVIWLSENLFNIGRYVADARAMKLPLVGGGDHDWNTILSRWGWLAYDESIGQLLNAAGCLGILLAVLWVFWRAWKDRHRAPEQRFAGMELAWPDR